MKLIVGLGNPGKQYEKTRHNLGFMVVERFLKDFEPVEKTVWENQKKIKSDIVRLEWQRQLDQKFPLRPAERGFEGQAKFKDQKPDESENWEEVILAKPQTYMNNSGMAVQLLTSYFSLLTSNLWVVYDDIDLPLGTMKIRFGGASAGHHGIDSIIESLKTDKFWRFRMGTGFQDQKSKIKYQKLRNVEDFVLNKFTAPEWGKARELIKRGSKAIEEALENGMDTAMNRFNTK